MRGKDCGDQVVDNNKRAVPGFTDTPVINPLNRNPEPVDWEVLQDRDNWATNNLLVRTDPGIPADVYIPVYICLGKQKPRRRGNPISSSITSWAPLLTLTRKYTVVLSEDG